jgi:hypothetical protein
MSDVRDDVESLARAICQGVEVERSPDDLVIPAGYFLPRTREGMLVVTHVIQGDPLWMRYTYHAQIALAWMEAQRKASASE